MSKWFINQCRWNTWNLFYLYFATGYFLGLYCDLELSVELKIWKAFGRFNNLVLNFNKSVILWYQKMSSADQEMWHKPIIIDVALQSLTLTLGARRLFGWWLAAGSKIFYARFCHLDSNIFKCSFSGIETKSCFTLWKQQAKRLRMRGTSQYECRGTAENVSWIYCAPPQFDFVSLFNFLLTVPQPKC